MSSRVAHRNRVEEEKGLVSGSTAVPSYRCGGSVSFALTSHSTRRARHGTTNLCVYRKTVATIRGASGRRKRRSPFEGAVWGWWCNVGDAGVEGYQRETGVELADFLRLPRCVGSG